MLQHPLLAGDGGGLQQSCNKVLTPLIISTLNMLNKFNLCSTNTWRLKKSLVHECA